MALAAFVGEAGVVGMVVVGLVVVDVAEGALLLLELVARKVELVELSAGETTGGKYLFIFSPNDMPFWMVIYDRRVHTMYTT